MDMSDATCVGSDDRSLRVLILAPSGRDAVLAEHALARGGLSPHVCADIDQLSRKIAAGAGAVLIAEEALPRHGPADSKAWIGPEPQWSSLPLIVLTGRSSSHSSLPALRQLERRPNTSFVERPVPKRTLISMLRTALESRTRQYAMRDFLDEQARLQQALLQSERRANSVLESIVDGFVALDQDWRIVYINTRAEDFLRPCGEKRNSLLGKSFLKEFPEVLEGPFAEAYRRTLHERTTTTVQAFYPPLDSWFDVRASSSADGVAIHFLDISERKQAERHRELLINELNHRVKNTLSIVQGLASQTFRGTSAPAEMRDKFEERLAALAAAHNLLTQSNWEQASVEELASQVIAATCGYIDQIKTTGPSVTFGPKQAVTFAMALHELCTNALKYGALSSEQGRVDLSWNLSAGERPLFTLVWREFGGPQVEKVREKGFGSSMIEQALAQEFDGEVTMEFRAEGLVCTMNGTLARSGQHEG